jgi:hypothetical protein
MESPTVESWRNARSRDVVVLVRPPGDGEPFAIAFTAELELLLEYARRVRLLLTARHQVDADAAVQWVADAGADDRRVLDVLARLDGLAP